MGLTFCFSGSATDWTAGNLSLGVVAGSTHAILSIKNTDNVPVKFYFRETGTSDEENRDITPGESKQITIALTSARTIEYKIEGGGSVSCYTVTAWGTGLVPSSITSSDVTSWLEMLGYTISATGDITTAQVQLCLDKVVNEVGMAASMFELKALYAPNTAFKNRITLEGAVAEALYALRNKGASTGLTQDRIIMNTETADRYKGTYDKAIDDMKNGWNLGA